MDFKDTVILPKTDFPMKGDLPKREPERLAKWRAEADYSKLMSEREGAEQFIVHCGPPYANGHLHSGHMIPSVLKDVVVRFKSLQGYHTPFIPGWDCHGLPIEWKMEKELEKIGKKKALLTSTAFKALCRDYANEWVNVQKSDWQRMGCLADWDDPYLTMDYGNEADIVRELGRIASKGLMYKDNKPVMWSPLEETALAEAEIEYEDMESSSVYFRVPLSGKRNEFLLVWTTTPWTIPLNKAVAVGENLDYSAIQVEDSLYWVAADLVEKASALLDVPAQVVETVKGSILCGETTKHPIYQIDVPVLSGHHVTSEDGTGIVHIAPAHGQDDFLVGKLNNLDTNCYVLGNGHYSHSLDDMPYTGKPLSGQHIFEIEKDIIAELKEAGNLIATKSFMHSCPVSWRSKSPLITRTTPQWFIALDIQYSSDGSTLREVAIEEVEKTQWIPEEGHDRLLSMIKNRPDWCVSRQREWGVPISILQNRITGDYILDQDVFESIATKFEQHGVEAWTDLSIAELLPKGWLDKNYLKEDDLKKETDILDVWFDAGSSYAHVLQKRGLGGKADLYLEGVDQHRGWFQSSLLISAAVNEQAPYKAVLTHGFVVDEKGHKVSKSIGNGEDAVTLMNKYGADTMRLWVITSDYRGDLRFGPSIMNTVNDSYKKIRNTIRFMMGNLHDYDSSKEVAYEMLPSFEKWALGRLAEVMNNFDKDLNEYRFNRAFSHIQNFFVNDLSSLYFDCRKDSLYCDQDQSLRRRSVQTVLSHIYDNVVPRLSSFIPFTCDESWREMKGECATLYTQLISSPPQIWTNLDVDKSFEEVLHLRSKIYKAFEEVRADKGWRLTSNLEAITPEIKVQEDLQADLPAIFKLAAIQMGANVQTVELKETNKEKCPRCWTYNTLSSIFGTCVRCESVLQKNPTFLGQYHIPKQP